MSYQNQRQELGLAGSAAPLNTTIDGSKWHHGVDAVGIAKLTKISTEINDTFDKAARDFARTQINLGRLLNEARAIIPGDQQFGQWREKNTPITNKSTANKLMNLAKQVGDGRITQEMVNELPLSTLKELISAPDTVLVHVRDKLREGETVTRTEVRELGKAEKDEPELDDAEREAVAAEAKALAEDQRARAQQSSVPTATAQPKAPTAPAGPPRVTLAAVADDILSLPLLDRMRRLDPKKAPPFDGCKPEEWAWLVYGLDPMPAYHPNFEVINVLHESYANDFGGQSDEDDLANQLSRAYAIIEALY